MAWHNGWPTSSKFKELLFDSNTYKKPEILKSKIEWKLLDVNLHIKFVQKSLCLKSKQFYNGKCSAIKWKLRFFPNGYTEDAISIALVYVGNDNSEARIKARFTIYAISSDGKRVDICSNKDNFRSYFQTAEFVIDLERSLHPDDSLLLICEVEYATIFFESEKEDIESTIMMNSMGRKYEDNEDRLRILKKSFIKMFEKETLADFVIKIDDETINTHRCVLAQNSEVFKRMLGQNMIEAKIGEIKIVDCSIDCFRAMLEFFYSGEIEINTFEKLGEDLYAIADKYEVVTLKEVCEQYMAMSITSTNFKKRYDCAKTYGLLGLEKSCIKYIYANREEFLISKEWEEFKSLNGESAFKMLEDALLGKFVINEEE